MSELNFSWKFGDYWITTVHENWLGHNHDYDRRTKIRWNCPIELCKYNPGHETRYTLAYFERDKEGDFELKSVGGRLFEEIDATEIGDIWAQLQAAQKMLDAYAEANYYEDKYGD